MSRVEGTRYKYLSQSGNPALVALVITTKMDMDQLGLQSVFGEPNRSNSRPCCRSHLADSFHQTFKKPKYSDVRANKQEVWESVLNITRRSKYR